MACPDWMRRAHACAEDGNSPSSFGIVRVALLPSWWQVKQPSVLMTSSHWPWVFRCFGKPLPSGPVPGNSLLPGILSMAYQ